MWVALVFLFVVAGVNAQDTWEVQIDQGILRGYRDTDIFAFHDVPYATVPSGSAKFKAPLPAPVWTQTFDAVYRGIICEQALAMPIDQKLMQLNMQEDCLVANIFVPDTNATDLPVFVNVHGGAYYAAAGQVFKLTNLARTQRVIVVTFNYRLGVQGFLCLGTEDVPGNAGMKDQVALLRWVNRNIAGFGGNPNDVTIGGCSAGGGSVDFLTVSPMTRGLYNKVMTGSGSVIGLLGAQMDPIENAKTYARTLNFNNVEDPDALEEFYKTSSYQLLNSNIAASFIRNIEILFTPCVERDTGSGEERFLSDTPWNILRNGQYPNLPLLYGYANMEGLFAIAAFDLTKEDMTANFSNYLPLDLQFENDAQREEVAQTIREFYFGDKGVTAETVLDFVDYYTDVMFAYPMLKGLKLRREANNDTVYMYEYSFVDDQTPFVPYTNVRGANHCAQEMILLDEDTTNLTEDYVRMKTTMRDMWINFITSGKPVSENSSLPEWPPVNQDRTPHMALKNNSAVRDTIIGEERARFWDDIYARYYRQPVPPVPGSAAAIVHSALLMTGVLITKYICHW